MRVVKISLDICWEDWQKHYCIVSTSDDGILILNANDFQNNKRVTYDKVQQAEWENKRNRKHPHETVISVNEVWYQILNYPGVINNLNFVMIQRTLLETRTGESLQNPDNPTSYNFTQSGANDTNNTKK